MLARDGAGSVGDDRPVGNGRVARIRHERNVVGGLEGRLVEAGEGAARVRGLELRDCVVAEGGFGEIKAAQFIVQNAAIADGQRGLAHGEIFREGEGGLLLFLVERDGSLLFFAASGHGHALKVDLGGVQLDALRGLSEDHVDRFDAGEGRGLQVGREG